MGHGHDDLFHLAVAQAGQKFLDAQLFGSNAVHRAEQTVQYMVQAVILPCAFKRLHIAGRFHHADHRRIAFCTGTDGADIRFCIILADTAAMELGVGT